MQHTKYQPFPHFNFPERTWPNQRITKAPIWCSTDLRDGNQALEIPMNLDQKLTYFKLLVQTGFKEIEVAFPSASETEFQLVRTLIEQNMIPDDVSIQVLTQARNHLIDRTFESVKDAKKAIVHLYNSTCPLHRDVVFGMDKEEIKELAIQGAIRFNELAEKYGKERFQFEYSPETFNATEMDYVVELCNAVLDEWRPTPEHKVIINLPETVQYTTPNIYADQIEYVSTRIKYRDSVIISLHTHNDQGTGVAASELGIMAGAERVEGTLFGNGERTGNMDIVTLALNLYTHGIDIGLDFTDIDMLIEKYEQATGMYVHPRHPYAGELVFTAFSGSHQDAIKKGMDRQGDNYTTWKMPYLIMDPKDVGRDYRAIIRVNSQSGKGGVFYLLNRNYGISPPKPMQQDFGQVITNISDQRQKELSAEELYEIFKEKYVNTEVPVKLIRFKENRNGSSSVEASVEKDGVSQVINGAGNGLLDALCNAITKAFSINFDIHDYVQQAMKEGSDSGAISYIQIMDESGKTYFGAGMNPNVSKSAVLALFSAVNAMMC